MINTRHSLLLILIIWFLTACTIAQSKVTPSITVEATQEFVNQPASTIFVRPTKPANTQTAVPSSVPNLLDSLSPGIYIGVSDNEGSGWNSIPSIHLFSLNGQDMGILAENVPSTATISSAGKEIAYIYFNEQALSNLAILNLQTNQTGHFSVSGCHMPDSMIGWSPDRTQIALSCGNYISVIDITGDKAKLVSLLRIANGTEDQLIDQIAWSPDGNYLSFYIADQSDTQDLTSHVPYLANPICPNNVTECEISPYPLGTKDLSVKDLSIAKWTLENLLAISQGNRIYVFDPVTKQRVSLISIPVDNPISSFAWLPDNQSVLFSVGSQDLTAIEIYSVASSGCKPDLISSNANDIVFWIQLPNKP